MTYNLKSLIKGSNYLIDYEKREYIMFDPTKSPEEIYEQLREEYGPFDSFNLDVAEDFEQWVNHNYTAMDILNGRISGLYEAQTEYENEVIDPAVEEFFTDSQYFAWL